MSTSVTTPAAHGDAHAQVHTYQRYPTMLPISTIGMLLFLMSELALFGSFFMYYGYERIIENMQWPLEPFHIPADETGINTAILVASSFTCELALISLMRRRRRGLVLWLVVTFVMGTIFLILQGVEYNTIGFTPKDEAFGSIFFSLTGLHGFHVFVGLLLLLFCIIRSIRGHFSPEAHPGLLVSALYWHFVDVVWIILYTVVYLLPDLGGH